MAQVMTIQPDPNTASKRDQKALFQIGGAIIGGIVGKSPQAAVAGAAAGGAVSDFAGSKDAGGAVGSAVNFGSAAGSVGGGSSGGAAAPAGGLGLTQSEAMARRRDELQTDKLTALREAEAATSTLPEQQRQRLLPTLTQARMLEQQKRGMV